MMAREAIARTPPPPLLFPFNNVKDQTGLPAPPCHRPAAARSGYLVAPEFRVKQLFQQEQLANGPAPKSGGSALLFRSILPVNPAAEKFRLLPNYSSSSA